MSEEELYARPFIVLPGEDDKSRRYNRPGLSEIKYSTGSHSEILPRMISKLSSLELPDKPGNRPLRNLSARTQDDASIALLDSCAMVLDVLSFYMERIANEGYMRTARERRSVLELARSVGYELKPGVAASTYLAFFVEEAVGAPPETRIPAGTQILSIPGEDELPQTFETLEDFVARSAWNRLRPTLKDAQVMSPNGTMVYLAGLGLGLEPGRPLLLTGPGDYFSIRFLTGVREQSEKVQTLLEWSPGLSTEEAERLGEEIPGVFAFRRSAYLFGHNAPSWGDLALETRRSFVGFITKTTGLVFLPGGEESLTGAEDAERFVSSGADGKLRLWNARSGTLLTTLNAHPEGNTLLTLKPPAASGTDIIASGGVDGLLRFYQINVDDATLYELATENLHDGLALTAMAFSDSGLFFASGDAGGTVLIRDADNSGTILNGTIIHPDGVGVTALAFRSLFTGDVHDDPQLCVAYENGEIKIFSVTLLEPVAPATESTIEVQETTASPIALAGSPVSSLDVSSGGRYAVYGRTDGSVTVLDLTKNDPVAPAPGYYTLNRSFARSIVFYPRNPDASLPPPFLTAGDDGSLTLWEIKKSSTSPIKIWAEIGTFAGHTSSTNCVTLSPPTGDGDMAWVLSGGADEIKLWKEKERTFLRGFQPPPPTDYPQEWPGFSNKEAVNNLYEIDLNNLYPRVVPGSRLLLRENDKSAALRIVKTETVNRKDFLLNESITRLQVEADGDGPFPPEFDLRKTVVYLESVELQAVERPLDRTRPVQGDRIELDRLVTKLESGHVLIVNGKRNRLRMKTGTSVEMESLDRSRKINLIPGDILKLLESPQFNDIGEKIYKLENLTEFQGTVTLPPGASEPFEILPAAKEDEIVSEKAVLKNVFHGRVRSELELEDPISYDLDPSTVEINANIVVASHGETITQILGSGDGSAINQSFILNKAPLTFTPGATSSGSESSLQIFVDRVRWREVPSLYTAGPRDRVYIIRLDDDGTPRVIFGDGKRGARLSTGVENIEAVYRSGIGPTGEVAARSLRLPKTRPLAVSSVDNPLAATGSAGPETLATARFRAPSSVLTLGRIVSLQDFEDFARTFAGIAKARVKDFDLGEKRMVHLTVAPESRDVLEKSSPLYDNLTRGIDAAREPIQQVIIDSFEMNLFNISAKILVDPRYIAKEVQANAQSALRETFSFEERELGQDVTAAEVIAVIQKTPGLEAVDLDHLYYDSATLFVLDLKYQNEFDFAIAPGEELLAALNAGLSAGGGFLSESATIIRENKGRRWLIREKKGPELTVYYAVIKEKGQLYVYDYDPIPVPSLLSEKARREEGIYLPAQLLLLNPDPAGVILTLPEET